MLCPHIFTSHPPHTNQQTRRALQTINQSFNKQLKPYLSAPDCLSSRLSIRHYMTKLPLLLLSLNAKQNYLDNKAWKTKNKCIYLREFPPELHGQITGLMMTRAAQLCGDTFHNFLSVPSTWCNRWRCIITNPFCSYRLLVLIQTKETLLNYCKENRVQVRDRIASLTSYTRCNYQSLWNSVIDHQSKPLKYSCRKWVKYVPVKDLRLLLLTKSAKNLISKIHFSQEVSKSSKKHESQIHHTNSWSSPPPREKREVKQDTYSSISLYILI